jgi:hypothetical protein
MMWFDILRLFMSEYTVSQDVLEEVYGVFKPYFPISLPRASQVAITPEELKLQLRKCFSANHLLADKVFPFLLGKLDQGDAVTVNVKVSKPHSLKREIQLTKSSSISSKPCKLVSMSTAIHRRQLLPTPTKYGAA